MKRVLYFAFLFVTLCAHSQETQQENKIDILNSNTIEFDKNLGNGAQRLLGDVKFKHEDMVMNCDSAYFYSEGDSLIAFGNIHMVQGDTLHLYGKRLRYNGITKMAQIRKNVRMVDRETTLTTEFLDYDINASIGYYFNGGKIINVQNILTSQRGYYHSKEKVFFFKEKVLCTNPDDTIKSDTMKYNTQTKVTYFFGPTEIYSKDSYIYCEDGWYNTSTDVSRFGKHSYIKSGAQTISGDSLYYDGKRGIGRGVHNVSILDTSRNIIMKGHYGYYLRDTEYTFMTDSAVMLNYNDKDTLFMHSDTMLSHLDSTGKYKVLKAFHGVRFYKKDMQGRCDSLEYSQSDSTMRMFVVPVLWSDENQLTGELIELFMANGHLDKAKLHTTPFITSKEDSSRFNQIRGKLMTCFFQNDKLYKILVNGNGQTLYYPKDGNEIIGVNKADCSDLVIHVDSNRVQQIDFMNKPDATMYPLDQAPIEESILKGFVWYQKYRPMKREDIFIYPENVAPLTKPNAQEKPDSLFKGTSKNDPIAVP